MKRNILSFLVIFTLFCQSAFSVTYTFTSTGNWSTGSWNPSNPGTYIGTFDSVIIVTSANCSIDVDVSNCGHLINKGILNISSGGSVYNCLDFTNETSGTITNTTSIGNSTVSTITNFGIMANNLGATITNNGGIKIYSGTITNNGNLNLNNNGSIQIYNGGTLINNSGATLSQNTNTSYDISCYLGGTILNFGTMSLHDPLYIEGNVMNKSGAVMNVYWTVSAITTGILENESGAELNVYGNGSLYTDAYGGQIINNSGATITNSGTIHGKGTLTQNGTFTNTATAILAPGDSPGSLQVTGNLDFGAGTYICEVNGANPGSQYDVISISNSTSITSSSKLNLIFGYTPPLNNTFDIINGGTIAGNFDPSKITVSGGNVAGVTVTNTGSSIRVEIAALPIELVSFIAIPKNHEVQLQWTTNSEKHNAGFEIQRSIQGIDWQILNFVNGSGTTQERHDYTYLDASPNNGLNYYRLLQKDFDGENTFSKVVSVEMKSNQKDMLLFPNPTKNFVQIYFDQEVSGELELIDWAGRIIKKELLNNENHLTINLKDFPDGVYIIRADGQAQMVEKK